MTNYSLELKFNSKPIFTSNGKWLYPLFDLENFLNTCPFSTESLELYDKIIGKASALLITRLNIKKVTGGIVSKPAELIFQANNISYTLEIRVDLIDCKTEHLLKDISDPEEAHMLLKERAGLLSNQP
ncbi:MAG: DUF1893 domain-containing protein [Spirochaetales bacterium]|nr:DUF1893 domain-containing protein [Spirochaetales bacterium]